MKYPKLLCLAVSCVAAYAVFQAGWFEFLPQWLHGRGYISIFVAGLLFSLGFTAPFAVAIFIAMADTVNPFYAAPIAGAGAFIMDMTIFNLARFSLRDELLRLRGTRVLSWLHDLIFRDTLSEKIRLYLLWSIAGIVIASPLPDEVGVTLISGADNIDSRKFGAICWVLNTVGICLILFAARSIG